MYRCKECGNVVKASVAYIFNKDFNIGRDGEPTGKCLKRYEEEYEGIFFFCEHCEKQSDVLEDIATWEKEGPNDLDCIG